MVQRREVPERAHRVQLGGESVLVWYVEVSPALAPEKEDGSGSELNEVWVSQDGCMICADSMAMTDWVSCTDILPCDDMIKLMRCFMTFALLMTKMTGQLRVEAEIGHTSANWSGRRKSRYIRLAGAKTGSQCRWSSFDKFRYRWGQTST